MSRRRIGGRKRQRGNAFIELALAFTFLLPVFLGTFQFGLAFHYYNELLSAVRAGGRYASYRAYDSPTSTPTTAYVAAVQNMTVYGDPNGGTRPIVPGLTTAKIAVSVGFSDGVPSVVRVRVNDFPLNVVFKTFRISKPEAIFPYVGVYMPAS
jgi:Flp pilus assembly protein TadG